MIKEKQLIYEILLPNDDSSEKCKNHCRLLITVVLDQTCPLDRIIYSQLPFFFVFWGFIFKVFIGHFNILWKKIKVHVICKMTFETKAKIFVTVHCYERKK